LPGGVFCQKSSDLSECFLAFPVISIANECTPLSPSIADSNKKPFILSLALILSSVLPSLFCLDVKYPPIALNKLLYCLLKNLLRLNSTIVVALTV